MLNVTDIRFKAICKKAISGETVGRKYTIWAVIMESGLLEFVFVKDTKALGVAPAHYFEIPKEEQERLDKLMNDVDQMVSSIAKVAVQNELHEARKTEDTSVLPEGTINNGRVDKSDDIPDKTLTEIPDEISSKKKKVSKKTKKTDDAIFNAPK